MAIVRWLVLLFLFIGTSKGVSALKCAHCIHLDFPSSPPQGFPNLYRNPSCEDFDQKVLSGNVLECPEDSAHVCATVKGVYTFDSPTVNDLRMNSTLRKCLPRPQGFNNDTETSICLDGDGDEAASSVDLIGAAEAFGDNLGFKGQVCYCNGDNCNGASSDVGGGFVTAFVVSILVAMVMAM